MGISQDPKATRATRQPSRHRGKVRARGAGQAPTRCTSTERLTAEVLSRPVHRPPPGASCCPTNTTHLRSPRSQPRRTPHTSHVSRWQPRLFPKARPRDRGRQPPPVPVPTPSSLPSKIWVPGPLLSLNTRALDIPPGPHPRPKAPQNLPRKDRAAAPCALTSLPCAPEPARLSHTPIEPPSRGLLETPASYTTEDENKRRQRNWDTQPCKAHPDFSS